MKDFQSRSQLQGIIGILPALPMMLIGPIIQGLDLPWVRLLSFVPFFTPGTMMLRLALTQVPRWKARIQVYVDEEQDRLLEHLAKVRRGSKSQLIRESIASYLEELIPPGEDPALGILGLAGKVGKENLAERHDDYLVSIHSEKDREGGRGQG